MPCTDPNCKGAFCDRPKHAIYGMIELGNGTVTRWLDFIDARLSLEEAKAEAIRIKKAHWKGCVVRCWTIDPPTETIKAN